MAADSSDIRIATASDLRYFVEILSEDLDADELTDARNTVTREFLEIGSNRDIYILFQESAPLAVVQVILNHADDDPDLADGRTTAHIHHLRVRKQHRRLGIGRQLMSDIESRYREHGFRQLTLGVDNWNDPAIRFYNSLGYRVFKTEAGRTPDEIVFYMRKEL